MTVPRIVDYIQKTKPEIVALGPGEIHDEHIPNVADQLDAVVKATEETTGAILDAAEELEQLTSEVTGAVAEKITNITTKIFEAFNFQDITGQRISKVLNSLKHIETKVKALALACGQELNRENAQSTRKGAPKGEDALLEGPQLPGAGNSQKEIDTLLNSFD